MQVDALEPCVPCINRVQPGYNEKISYFHLVVHSLLVYDDLPYLDGPITGHRRQNILQPRSWIPRDAVDIVDVVSFGK